MGQEQSTERSELFPEDRIRRRHAGDQYGAGTGGYHDQHHWPNGTEIPKSQLNLRTDGGLGGFTPEALLAYDLSLLRSASIFLGGGSGNSGNPAASSAPTGNSVSTKCAQLKEITARRHTQHGPKPQ